MPTFLARICDNFQHPLMKTEVVERRSDELLLPFLRAARGAESEHLLSLLIAEHAEPLIKTIIGNKLGVYVTGTLSRESNDTEDVHSEAVTHLLARLCDCKSNPNGSCIGDFRGYVAVTTYNA